MVDAIIERNGSARTRQRDGNIPDGVDSLSDAKTEELLTRLLLSQTDFGPLVDWLGGLGLSGDDFTREDLRAIYEAAQDHREAGDPCDIRYLSKRLDSYGQLELVGGKRGLAELIAKDFTPSPVHAERYVQDLIATGKRRRAVRKLEQAIRTLNAPDADLSDIVARVDEDITSILNDDAGRVSPLSSRVYWVDELVESHPTLKPQVIEGILRREEVMNLIASSKLGKSFMSLALALSIITGRDWLGKFATNGERVLLIDNELHTETLAERLRLVREAMGVELSEFKGHFAVKPLRGRQVDIHKLRSFMAKIKPGEFDVIILDALYRFLPAGISENDNAAMTQIFNVLDSYAAMTGAAIVVIHHTSKGDQSGKSSIDVGSGAGAFARACDTHLTIRPHQTDGYSVLEGDVRSNPKIEPLTLRWNFPLWTACGDIEPVLRDPKTKQKQSDDERCQGQIVALMERTGQNYSQTALTSALPFGRDRIKRAIDALLEAGRLDVEPGEHRGGEGKFYSLVTNFYDRTAAASGEEFTGDDIY